MVTACLACLLCLFFTYYLKVTFPRDHQPHPKLPRKHKYNLRRKVAEETLYADFMEQVGTRMLQVDAWEQKMAWQRLQNDLLLRREVGDLLGCNVEGGEDVFFGDEEPDFALSDLYLHEDIDVAANRRERASHVRSMEDRLVDRVQAAFALAPDLPRTFGGVQVPFSLEEFRDYIIGYSLSEHRKFKNDALLDAVRGQRRQGDAPKQPAGVNDDRFLPHRDYIVWATSKYLKYSRFKKYDDEGSDDEAGRSRLAGTDHEASDPNRFKMYPSALYNVAGNRIDDMEEYEVRKNKYVCQEKDDLATIHAERLANDPQYLRTLEER